MEVNNTCYKKIWNYMENNYNYLESLRDAEHSGIQLFPFEGNL